MSSPHVIALFFAVRRDATGGQSWTEYGISNTQLHTSRTIERVLFTFAGATLYNMIELLIQIPLVFKSGHGFYFWALLLSTIGILPYTLGLFFKFFGVIKGHPLVFLAVAMIDAGWQLMVTGQSFVLYSRLHLICRSRNVQRAVLCMILTNCCISNIPTTIFVFGAASKSPERWVYPYSIWERLQLCLYFTQELIISGIYVFETIRMLKPGLYESQDTTCSGRTDDAAILVRRLSDSSNKALLRRLLWINVTVTSLDIAMLVIEFIGHFEVQVVFKGFCYSVKLKMEYRILSQLKDMASVNLHHSQAHFGCGGITNLTDDQTNSVSSPVDQLHKWPRRHSWAASENLHSWIPPANTTALERGESSNEEMRAMCPHAV